MKVRLADDDGPGIPEPCDDGRIDRRLAGGLGGFLLPILFGILQDLTGVRSTCFMLMYGVVWVSLIWMYWTEVRRTEMMGQNAPVSPLSRSFAR